MLERREISVDRLTLDTVQSREKPWVGDDEDRRLAASVSDEGLLQDLLVRPVNGSTVNGNDDPAYGIIAGSRRYHAAMEAGNETVPCKVVEADDVEAAWKSLSENTDRRDLSEQEIARQIKLIFELVRPHEEPTECPDCGESVDGEEGLKAHCAQTGCRLPDPAKRDSKGGDDELNRFFTKRQAVEYIAEQFLGRRDESALATVRGHLRTAELPPVLQALFKSPDDRTTKEQTALENYGIDARTTLGSGEGRSGTSSEVVKLHEAVESEFDSDAVDPTEAVLETVGSLTYDEMSEQELRRTLREFRRDAVAEVDDSASIDEQRETFRQTLDACAEQIREQYEEIEPNRPFKKVDILGPEKERYCRWHVRAMQRRSVENHSELVRELYQERLDELAESEGWS